MKTDPEYADFLVYVNKAADIDIISSQLEQLVENLTVSKVHQSDILDYNLLLCSAPKETYESLTNLLNYINLIEPSSEFYKLDK